MKRKTLYSIVCLTITSLFLQINLAHSQCNSDRHNSSWFNSWISCEAMVSPNLARDTTHWISYNLGHLYHLGDAKIWNNNNPDSLQNGVKTIIIDYSVDGINWFEWDTISTNMASGLSTYSGDSLTNFDDEIAQYVLFNIIENHGGNCSGFSELKINVEAYDGPPLEDLDGDGYFSHVDCNDDNPLVFPGAEEVCDQLDNNCDDNIDEGLATSLYYADIDQDGFGDDQVTQIACSPPLNFVSQGGDCDDSEANVNSDQIEIPYNAIDDDCNPETLDDDLDQDGFLLADDCDDNNADINPDAIEIPNNEIDEDCDGMDLVTSTHEIANTTVNIYPNPVTDIINIEVIGQLNYQVSLYNLEGKLIKSKLNWNQINVETIPTGTYVLEIKDLKTNQKIVEKIIVGK